MEDINQYTDQEIVKAILSRNAHITNVFLYKNCYPLFRAIYNKFYTDCENPTELINQIYLYMLIPNRNTGKSKLDCFRFHCAFITWIKIITENYCHQIFTRKLNTSEGNPADIDRNIYENISLESDFDYMNIEDVKRILHMMPNKRYRRLIEYRYLDDRSNEETAMLLDLTMANYYNAHLRAKSQFCTILKKEGLI